MATTVVTAGRSVGLCQACFAPPGTWKLAPRRTRTHCVRPSTPAIEAITGRDDVADRSMWIQACVEHSGALTCSRVVKTGA